MSKLEIVKGNILDYLDGKDLIINSANRFMSEGSGVCQAIYRASGSARLMDYCFTTFDRRVMNVNEIRITPGFNLGIDILHIYCPNANYNDNNLDELKESYKSIFKTIKEKGYKDILSVSLGTGVHGYNHQEIANDIINLLKTLVNEYDVNFTLVLFDKYNYELYSNFL